MELWRLYTAELGAIRTALRLVGHPVPYCYPWDLMDGVTFSSVWASVQGNAGACDESLLDDRTREMYLHLLLLSENRTDHMSSPCIDEWITLSTERKTEKRSVTVANTNRTVNVPGCLTRTCRHFLVTGRCNPPEDRPCRWNHLAIQELLPDIQ
eukprot:gene19392-6625_t